MNLILDIARGIAAMSVFIYHIEGVVIYSLPALARVAQYGEAGVPLFFVISGFVITASAETTLKYKRSANAFLKRRFMRIYPPFWMSILVVVAIPYIIAAISFFKSGHLQLPQPKYLQLSYVDWLQVISLSKVFAAENPDLQAQFTQVNAVYWTLAIEFQFYLCVYAALLCRKYFYTIISSVSLLSLILVVYPLPINYGCFIHYWPMFTLGIILYYLVNNGYTLEQLLPSCSRAISGIVIILLLSSIILFAYQERIKDLIEWIFPSYFLGFAVISFIILWLATPLESLLVQGKNSKNMFARTIIKTGAYLGVISYSVYLLHGKISQLPAMFVRQLLPVDSIFYPLLIIFGTIGLCILFFVFCEKPFMSKKQKQLYDQVVSKAETS